MYCVRLWYSLKKKSMFEVTAHVTFTNVHYPSIHRWFQAGFEPGTQGNLPEDSLYSDTGFKCYFLQPRGQVYKWYMCTKSVHAPFPHTNWCLSKENVWTSTVLAAVAAADITKSEMCLFRLISIFIDCLITLQFCKVSLRDTFINLILNYLWVMTCEVLCKVWFNMSSIKNHSSFFKRWTA